MSSSDMMEKKQITKVNNVKNEKIPIKKCKKENMKYDN